MTVPKLDLVSQVDTPLMKLYTKPAKPDRSLHNHHLFNFSPHVP
jgi:hypothetical protein